MALHAGKFTVGQAPRLLQDRIRNADLAYVMEQTGQPQLSHMLAIKAFHPANANHQGANRNRMQIGIVVLGLETHDLQQRLCIPLDFLLDIIKHTFDRRTIDPPTHFQLIINTADHLGRTINQCLGLVLGRRHIFRQSRVLVRRSCGKCGRGGFIPCPLRWRAIRL